MSGNKPKKHGYADIASHYRQLIADGTLAPGDVMPSMSKVCDEFNVSITTANRAFRLLKTEGLTEPKPGVGTVVADQPRVAATASARLGRIARTGKAYDHKERSVDHTAQLRSMTDPILAGQLGVELHDEVVLRTRTFVKDGKKTVFAVSCIHVRALGDVPELLSPEPFDRFWQEIYTSRTGRQVTKSPERRSARLAYDYELEALGVDVEPGTPVPVLVLVNTFSDENGPLEVWEDVYAPGLWQVDTE
ncbi:GntR family transcriptional regulator [Streptomyces sp. DHE17-7]|uniref:GntR family transcriptional regulator n=1 Tax=Streptomyces sp. DHE17-7 TaxID=2759949 RepID=UPI000EBF943C|nr:GntR family transcriptional regulator [Streptomyces sp. DHE17-7]MBJ6623510.1 GntR family transcriptional regulator [Streptomyces sp. DHE17-7]RIH58767.1 GntR family transcriptional regulator [Streptomyces sp. SHP22-7]